MSVHNALARFYSCQKESESVKANLTCINLLLLFLPRHAALVVDALCCCSVLLLYSGVSGLKIGLFSLSLVLYLVSQMFWLHSAVLRMTETWLAADIIDSRSRKMLDALGCNALWRWTRVSSIR